jgi:hypothetical protein
MTESFGDPVSGWLAKPSAGYRAAAQHPAFSSFQGDASVMNDSPE